MTLNATGCLEAFKAIYRYILSILSTLCFFYRRPLSVGTVTVFDSKYDIEIRTEKIFPAPEKMVKPLASLGKHPIAPLFSIYYHGMNSVDIPYRYICFFKIYEAWFEKPQYFFDREKTNAPKITITKNLLAAAYTKKHHDNLINKDFGDYSIYKELKSFRHYLVHPVIDRKEEPSYFDLDSVEYMEGVEAASNLMERMATKILDTELDSLAPRYEEIGKFLKIYKDIRKNRVEI